MRDFNDSDRRKKAGRISLPDNPGNLSAEALSQLEQAVRAAIRDGYVSCPTAWKVAADRSVSRLDVGAMIDRLGIRVTDCQLGCFKVAKTSHADLASEPLNEVVSRRLETLTEQGDLTCAGAFAIVDELKVKPMAVADVANVRGYKIRKCQLGCF